MHIIVYKSRFCPIQNHVTLLNHVGSLTRHTWNRPNTETIRNRYLPKLIFAAYIYSLNRYCIRNTESYGWALTRKKFKAMLKFKCLYCIACPKKLEIAQLVKIYVNLQLGFIIIEQLNRLFCYKYIGRFNIIVYVNTCTYLIHNCIVIKLKIIISRTQLNYFLFLSILKL